MPYYDAYIDQVAIEDKATPRQKALAYAIAQSENDASGRYGVRSVPVSNRKEAARVLLNSIRNNERRYLQAGSPGDFVDFMGKRWAPVGASNDPKGLNRNWAGNVKRFMRNR